MDRDQVYFGLWLCHLKDKPDETTLIAIAKSPQELTDWMDSMRVDPYKEITSYYDSCEVWSKCFDKGSLLEWYAEPFSEDIIGSGIKMIGSMNQFLATQETKFIQTINGHLIKQNREG